MDGFGEFLGSLIEGVTEGAMAATPWGEDGYDRGGREADGNGAGAYETYERYLAGGPRDLNINDL